MDAVSVETRFDAAYKAIMRLALVALMATAGSGPIRTVLDII